MNKKTRTYNAMMNSFIGMLVAIANVVINFGVRIVIVRTLGDEINGLHNMFQSLINVLAVVETSFSTAMIINLYGPIKENDTYVISKTMAFYRRLYLLIAFFFLLIGLVLCLNLNGIIETSISMKSVRRFFVLFLLSFVANYITYSYRVVLFAEQKNRISSLVTIFSELLFRGCGVVLSALFNSYIFYLLFLIGEKLFGNLICAYYVRKTHNDVKWNKVTCDDSKIKEKVINSVKPLLVNQFANVIQTSSQSIVIGALLGNIAVVGYYGNYQLVVSAVALLFSQIGAAFTSSFGNLAIEKNTKHMYATYRKVLFLISSIAMVICSGFIVCIQPFIELAFGEKYLLSFSSVVIFALGMFTSMINVPIISVQNAMGLHKMDEKQMVLQAGFVIVLECIGGFFFGMEGILLGALLPVITFTTIYKGLIINKKIFIIRLKDYLKDISGVLIKAVCICGISVGLCSYIKISNLLISILIRGISVIIINVLLILALSIKDPWFWQCKKMLFGAKK